MSSDCKYLQGMSSLIPAQNLRQEAAGVCIFWSFGHAHFPWPIHHQIPGFPPASKDAPCLVPFIPPSPSLALGLCLSSTSTLSRKSPLLHSFNMLKVTHLYSIKCIQYLHSRFPFTLQIHIYHCVFDLSLDILKSQFQHIQN